MRPHSPPFLVVHGGADRIIRVAQAQAFVIGVRAVSQTTVGYVELPGADHGFGFVVRWRAGPAMTVIGLFLNAIQRITG